MDQRMIKKQIEASLQQENLENTENRIAEIEQRLEEKVAALPFRIRIMRPKAVKQDMVFTCPSCNANVMTRVRPRRGARKLIKCGGCKKHWLLNYKTDAEFETMVVPEVEEDVSCVICSHRMKVSVPQFAGASIPVACPECDCNIQVSKTKIGVGVNYIESKELPSKFLDRAAKFLPEGPWPSGFNILLAQKMSITESLANRAIKDLIRSGRVAVPDRSPEAQVVLTDKQPNSNGEH